MKKLAIPLAILLIILSASPAFAEWELYAIETPDNTVSIMHYNTKSKNSLENRLVTAGYGGMPYEKITKDDIEADRDDRNFWELKNKKVKVNSQKKADWQAEQDALDAELEAMRIKMGLNEDEFKLIDKKTKVKKEK